MFKKILGSIFVVTVVVTNIVPIINVNAQSREKTYNVDGEMLNYEQFKQTLCDTSVGKVNFEKPLSIGSTNVELYCTFEDKDLAMNDVNHQFNSAIQFLGYHYNLGDKITDENWIDFRNAINSSNELGIEISDEMSFQFSRINAFFDIYENDLINEDISNLVDEYNSMSKARKASSSSMEILNKLDELTPNYSDNFGTITTFSSIVPMVGSSLNVAKATEYAVRHATSPNKSQYYYFNNGDCTNFMSQILEYSGVSQVVYDSEHSGWWHTNNKILGIIDNHKHSRSWTMADTFARYMGVTVSTTSINSWSNGLRQGDFIALDFTNDGSWDHLGYVTATDGTMQTYSGNGATWLYYDFKVAQHTSNYNAWASSSTNSWDTYAGVAKYGRVRG